ncbi:MAG: hypothetical protein LUQ47_04770, partial [Methanotrichaceae archaeon]|nr:hypothetical protein [Methanotrichaceae archaeon]
LALAAEHSGDHTIDQVCEIYSYLKYGNNSRKPWSYVDDPRGLDYFNYASESLSAGGASGSAGAGDCDDFAILMSSLVESIGGTTRIILAHNNSTGSHAYAEVYLGQLNAQNSQVANIIKWLENKYNTDKIFTHVDTDSKDVWLNLDWSADHPGGPIFPADRYDVLWIRDRIRKISLNLPEKSNHPPELIGLTSDIPSPQEHRTAIIWTAEANDSDNDQILYRFFLNGYPVSKWVKENKWIWMTNDTHVGNNTIEVRVKDEEHSDPDRFDNNKTTSFTIIAVNKKPVIAGLYTDKTSPQEVGATVTWTVESDDPENDPLLYRFYVGGEPLTNWSKQNELSWQTNETYIGNNQIEVRVKDEEYPDPDRFDNNKTTSFTIIAVNKKPVITGLYADKTSPQEVGATVTWLVESDDPENDPLLYRFYVDGKPLTNWSKQNEWSWQTDKTHIGNNQIEVQVRDGSHSDPDGYDYHKSSDFAIVAPKSQSRSSDKLNFDELFFIIILLGIPFYLIFRKL